MDQAWAVETDDIVNAILLYLKRQPTNVDIFWGPMTYLPIFQITDQAGIKWFIMRLST